MGGVFQDYHNVHAIIATRLLAKEIPSAGDSFGLKPDDLSSLRFHQLKQEAINEERISSIAIRLFSGYQGRNCFGFSQRDPFGRRFILG